MDDPFSIPISALWENFIPQTQSDKMIRAKLRCLGAECKTIGDLIKITGKEFLRIPNMGRKTLAFVEAYLAGIGLELSADGYRTPTDAAISTLDATTAFHVLSEEYGKLTRGAYPDKYKDHTDSLLRLINYFRPLMQ